MPSINKLLQQARLQQAHQKSKKSNVRVDSTISPPDVLQEAREGQQTGEAAIAPLSELAAISTTLNDESNKVNTLLGEFQRKLCAMNLGVEAWVQSPLTATLSVQKYQGSIKLDEPKHYSHEERLGFGQLDGRWGLLVRTVALERSQHRNFGDDWEWEEVDEGTPVALLQASRPTRIAALSKLDTLLFVLKVEAMTVVKSITEAEQMINKL